MLPLVEIQKSYSICFEFKFPDDFRKAMRVKCEMQANSSYVKNALNAVNSLKNYLDAYKNKQNLYGDKRSI